MKSFSGESFPSFFCIFLSLKIKLSAEEKTQSLQSEKYPGPVEVSGKSHWFCRTETPAATFFQSHWKEYMWSRAEGRMKRKSAFVLCGLLASEFFTWRFKKKIIFCGFKVLWLFLCFLNRGSLQHFWKPSENAEEKSEWWVTEWQHGLSYRHTSGLCSSTYPNLSQFIPLALL